MLLPALTIAQSLSGTYIIGSSNPDTNFKTLTAAVSRINAVGVAAPVTFLLDDTQYTTPDGSIVLKNFAGSSAVNTLTIKPNVNKTVSIASSTGQVQAVFTFEGADNIIIDGSNAAGGTSKDLTFINQNTAGYQARTVIFLSSKSGNSVNNVKIVNTKIKMTTRNGSYALLAGILSAGNVIDNAASNTADVVNTKLIVTNNEFINLRRGIVIRGNSTAKSEDILISSNNFGNVTGAKLALPIEILNANNFNILDNSIIGFGNSEEGNFLAGIKIDNSSNYSVKRNVLKELKATSNTFTGYGIQISGVTTNAVISENILTDFENLDASKFQGIGLNATQASSGIVIANNFVSKIYSGGLTDQTGHGIFITQGGIGTKVYYNTVAMNVQQPGWSTAFRIDAGTNFDVRNNSFTNVSIPPSDYNEVHAIQAISASVFATLDNNNYFATNVGRIGGDSYTTLAAWKTATGKDANSKNINPTFVSLTDLHLQAVAGNAGLNNTGVSIATFNTDIDGQARSLTTPDIGADEFSVAEALAIVPSAPATALTFVNVTANSFTINWVPGTGARRIVVLHAGSAVNALPTNATFYAANPNFGSGSQIGTGNYVVYNGNGNTISVTGLSGATNYHVSVFEYNGDATTSNYRTNDPLISSQLTLNASLGWQISNIDTQNTITFDATVSGVNNDQYLANGFAPTPNSGQLNSNAWSVQGFNDGMIPFGGTNTNPDFGRGVATASVTDGGIYSFTTSANNAALGIQPSAGDFTPGSVTLRFQNQTAVPITSLSIGYKVYIYNDEASSNSFNFSHSADNSSFTAIPELNVISPATADVNPSWKASYRVATITGFSIPANGFYYLKWNGAAVSTVGGYDQFGLDDIKLSANPNSNFVTFDGIAENFSVHGNTSLSGNTTVNGDLKFTAGKLSIGSNLFTIGGTVVNTITGGIKGGSTSNISIIGSGEKALSFDQTTVGTTNLLNNFSIPYAASAANNVVFSNAAVINGTLNVGIDQTLNLGTNALTGNLSTITINGNLRSQNTSTFPFPAGKTFGGTGTVTLDATAAQTLVSGTYNSVTLSSPAGTNASGTVTVNGILSLPAANPTAFKGSLDLGSNVLTMGPNAKNEGQGDVTGITTRSGLLPNTLYTFGHPNTSIQFANTGTLPTSLSLKTLIGNVPTWKSNAIQRTFDLIQTGAANTKAIIKAHYLDSELNGNSENKLVDFVHVTAGNQTVDQGRSNYNADENWVELTNVNLGVYFTSNFDAVNLSLANSTTTALTWNGSQSTSWTTAANWTNENGVIATNAPSDDTVVFIPTPSSATLHNPTINSATPIRSIDIAQGGIVNTPAEASTFTINGGTGAWINNGTFNAGTNSTVIFANLDAGETNLEATIAGETNFYNVIVNSGKILRPVTDNIMRIAGAFTNNGNFFAAALNNTVEYNGTNQTVIVPTGAANAYNNLVISGTGAIFPPSLRVDGDLTLNQTVNFSGKSIIMGGADLQKIAGTQSPVFDNLTINNSGSGVVLAINTSVNGTLTLTKGLLNISNLDLTLNQNAVAGTFNVNTMIVADGAGLVRRKFTGLGSYFYPIGELTSNPAYSPITVNMTEGTFAANSLVGVSVVDAIHPDNKSLQNYISRYWNVKQTGITGAKATITANYITQELLVPADTMIAGQITGTLDPINNPWIRFESLNGLTLKATNASLADGEVSSFTGIKGGAFTFSITGGGDACQDVPVTLTAVVVGGDLPFAYNWSDDLGNNAVATPEEFIGNKEYAVTVIDANGRKSTKSTEVITAAKAIAGTLSGNQTVCFASEPNPITASGFSTNVKYWQRSEEPQFSSPTTIANATNTLSGADAGVITGLTYFRAAIDNGSCSEVFTTAIQVNTKTTIWDGTSWSAGAPDSSTAVVISGNYNLAATINACTLTIINNAVVNVPAGFDVIINGAIIVDNATFNLESDTNLVQKTSALNYGNITVERESSKLYRLDYTMWGSPVNGNQTLKQFSSLTVSNRFYTYNSLTDQFNVIVPTTNGFTPGKGYLIRMPDNHTVYGPQVAATSWKGVFTGIPNNGNTSIALDAAGAGYNMISNPYASMINADAFLDENSSEIDGPLYFWRRRNAVPTGTEGTTAYYATYTKAGGVATVPTNPAETSPAPNGFIQVGQGFIVKRATTATTGNAMFTNAMRSNVNNDNQFFKNLNTQERSRIWLNVSNTAGEFGQTLVAYMDTAENGLDRADGKYLGDGTTALTSWLSDAEYIIQGRAPFVSTDVVALNFKTATAGNYTIAIDHVDGLFEGSQDIYLRDNLLGTTHDLKDSAYAFATQAGSFNARFDIVYYNTLAVENPTFDSNAVILYKNENNIVVNAGKVELDHVEVYDISGRLLATAKNINANEVSINVGRTNQVLIVKITSTDGITVNKKTIN